MPKKTRKEKIIANLRRELKNTYLRQDKDKPTELPFRKTVKRAKTKPRIEQSVDLSSFVKRDLKRTLVLSVLAISLELMLYSTLN